MTEYDRTVEWLYALEAARGMDFKLERVSLTLQRLGDPQGCFPILHVAGTNGKGSVAAMMHAMLSAAGYRVGLYTSPHLIDLTERICIGAEEIEPAEVVGLAADVRAAAAARGIDLTFFEILTVMAFLHFARRRVDAAVVEVGLGGRLDATNVVDPAVAVVTTIGCDHTEWLGDTLAQIAAEKGGIIKPGRPVVLGRIDGEALDVLVRIAAERGAPLLARGSAYRGGAGPGVHFEGLGWHLRELDIALRGEHQRDNAATALAALAAVRDRLPVGEAAIRRGLATVHWPGRLDVVASEPLTVLDGAHNLDGTKALGRALPELVAGRPVHVLFAVMGDKDWRPMVDHLAPRCASAVVTEVLRPRGAPAAIVADAFRRHCPTAAEPDPVRAWRLIATHARPNEAILATGSLFLVGALYAGVLPAALRLPDAPGALHP